MSNYNKILTQFSTLGLNEGSSLTEDEMKNALDRISQRNARMNNFSFDIAEELWAETEKNSNGTVTLRNYINVITRAVGACKEHIQQCEAELGSPNLEYDRRQELEESLIQYNDDLKILSVPFQLALQTTESRMYRESKANQSRVGAAPM